MKFRINYFVNIGMLLAFVVCAVSGILKLPELMIPFGNEGYLAVSLLHDWSGIAGTALLLIHLLLHARWFSQASRRVFSANPDRKKGASVSSRLRPNAMKSAAVLVALLVLSGGSAWASGNRHFSNPTIPQGIEYQAGSLKDGTYTGTATGYMPNLTVEVTVKNSVITSVRIVSHEETLRWFNRVIPLIPNRILSSQSTDIDVVTGATSSSYGIMAAVENALSGAAK